ncbi:MAG: ribonuclease III [bacterium]|nr:ribonuclease III [bacterium]
MAAVDPAALAARIGYRFRDETLGELALRHRSWVSEQRARPGAEPESNERLELLGDAVLNLVVSEHAYTSYPHMSVGQLAKVRASVVSGDALAEAAGAAGLGELLLMGRGEEAAGGRLRRSILADAAEAVIGAVYLDGGWVPARRLVLSLLAGRIEAMALDPGGDDHKTVLQERAAQQTGAAPSYRCCYSGPDHERLWRAVVRIGDRDCGAGEGATKKQAEQAAARAALAEFPEAPSPDASPEDANMEDGPPPTMSEGRHDRVT